MQYAKPSFTSKVLLITAACIWGFAFVAQKEGGQLLGVFTFNAIRFGLGTLTLLPILLWIQRKENLRLNLPLLNAGMLCGLFLFGGSYLQQKGISFTSAGNAGFLTGLYILIVPLVGIFFGKKSGIALWLGAIIAVFGMYLLTVKEGFQVSAGDILVFFGAFIWAGHVLVVSHFAPKHNAFMLAAVQFAVCSILSLIGMFLFEEPLVINIYQSYLPLLYTGILSVGGAFTLQVVAQKKVHPSVASIILSLESLFAAVGGWLLLNEKMSIKELTGCAIIMIGILVAQINFSTIKNQKITT